MRLLPQSRHPGDARPLTRRAALAAALLLGSVGVGAWQWKAQGGSPGTNARKSPGAMAGPGPGPGEDVCVVAPPTPYDPASGQPVAAAREVPADARCPVCGMYPARSRAWAAQVIFADGDAYFFDSPLSLLQYLGDVARYTRGRSADGIVARYVTDTDSGQWLDAAQATYVWGSNALGPMRAGNLPAFASGAAAGRFAQQRGGRALAFGDIDAPLLRTLAPGRGVGHAHPAA
jgi:copper chaperone NosL